MDIRLYFQKVRELELSMPKPFVLIVSVETPDGGVAGVVNEVGRAAAARLIVDGKARLATADEEREYHKTIERARLAAEEAAASARLQVTVVTEQDLRALRNVRQKG
jgi:hypothetical protein